jgi:hypothetical protein
VSTPTPESTRPFAGDWALAIALAPASQITAKDSAFTALEEFVTEPTL